MSGAALRVSELEVRYPGGGHAVRGVDLVVAPGETFALAGESGCGKTTLARAVLGLLPPGTRCSGSIRVGGVEVVGASRRTLRTMRGIDVGYVPQDPVTAFDPLRRVGHHVAQAWRAHRRTPPPGAVAGLVAEMGIPDAATRLRERPHQWSGGMLQRAAIAAAVAHRPGLVVADEPTSALDADLAGSVLATLRAASRSLLLISHDLALIAEHADRVGVLYGGRLVEVGDAAEVLAAPRHPYTAALVSSVPKPGAGLPKPLPGRPPAPAEAVAGCAFVTRCALAKERCAAEPPPTREGVACWVVGHG
ncbi:oligopeptide/dipeptide ABC transporter ATP-binding protein [Actinomadura pelletieri DSM 43383]|uniref:Oligopeptide/dipeptide ABC transporter ATP-binding protein n=1 Tax=Actinomadura pelletieri DSM 43383 TaxID=1120940 RepID=A0A495QZW9_9ACTN|nr:ABC transporter ATP-binding protein [Actinomadura pelletieri]RKS79608.1 oligopeptide/dipeptide ABC transporter ATP-binding protein [Actinomadura pelletieri DSM 43383]